MTSSIAILSGLNLDAAEIGAFCRKHAIRQLAIFGSALREDFRAESDLDVLVEFLPGRTPGFGFVTVEEELSTIVGRRVDLHTAGSLSRYFRDEVLKEARLIYDAA